jgi:hypothetical protein
MNGFPKKLVSETVFEGLLNRSCYREKFISIGHIEFAFQFFFLIIFNALNKRLVSYYQSMDNRPPLEFINPVQRRYSIDKGKGFQMIRLGCTKNIGP